MGRVTMQVQLGRLPQPDYRRDRNELNALEKVVFHMRSSALTEESFETATANGCHYVRAATYRLEINVDYLIARELRDRVNNAEGNSNRNKHQRVLSAIQRHARRHYSRVHDQVIPTWRTEAEASLDRSLPTQQNPTSTSPNNMAAVLSDSLRYWAQLLVARIQMDIYQWDREDYPRLETMIRREYGRRSISIPRTPQPAPFNDPEPTVVFPSCQNRTT